MALLDTIFSFRPFALAACLLAGPAGLLAGQLPAGEDEPSRRSASIAAAGTKRALIICGLPGDSEHRKLFAQTIEKLHKGLTGRCGIAAAEVMVRFGAESLPADGPALQSSRGLSTQQAIAADVTELRRTLRPEDALWVLILGHGHYDGRHSHLNLPGPDPDERALAKLFEGLKAREQVFFITTSASGFFLKPLAAPGRIVITATEADQEVNETVFPHALADQLAAPAEAMDRDKDGKVSLLELYVAVVANLMKQYVEAENLPTEHAQLDDNGDGRGSELQASYLPPELGGRGGDKPPPKIDHKDDGAVASRTYIEGARNTPR